MFPNVEIGDIWEYHEGKVNVPPERYVVLAVLYKRATCISIRALHCCTDTGGQIDERFMRRSFLHYWKKVA